MANTKTKKSGPSWMWRHKLLSLIALLIIAAGAYAAYNHIQTSSNKRDFQQARVAIDSVYDNALRSVGKPDNAEVGSDCARSHQEFSGGDLTCYLNTRFIYGVTNESEASRIFKKTQLLVLKTPAFKPESISNAIIDSYQVNSVSHAASDKFKLYNLICSINYVYDTSREIDLSIKDSTKKPFEVTIGCYGPAKQQYYRLSS
jgi:hypothetical protein